MNRRHSLLVLSLLTLLLPTARTAWAAPPDAHKPMAAAAAVVEEQLVKPLAEKEARRNRFSRSYIPPQARRVRVLEPEQLTDGRGAAFAAFAVDERSGGYGRRASDGSGHWRKDAIVGCVYPARDEIFIKRGDKFFAAGLLLGKKTAAADDTVCRPTLPPLRPAVSDRASDRRLERHALAR